MVQYQVKSGVVEDGKTEMTILELTKFLENEDGCISAVELSEAVRKTGGWFATWKGNRGAKSADANGDGIIDKDEVPKLAGFAEKELNIKIVPRHQFLRI